ncbi:hypothetical protein C1750_14800 [Stenotrophomonas pavanii]|uniref:hypothetical protein n=1 Tax=Stenotrophomonas pavanii TaxID=487698 RepID=UPI000CD0310A|nr:hypothetical protein [Stenotrophomonas pavanii]PNY71513.1 hypothetical protein C1750_14800 [Stenotrophomonas pavanii]
MANINRDRLLHILKLAEAANPKHLDLFAALGKDAIDDAVPEIQHLKAHGLLDVHLARLLNGEFAIGPAVITAAGLDYLAEDGGLTRELGVVTIKLHEHQLHQLIELQIHRSELPQTQKQRLLDQLRQLPAETTKHLAMQLVDAGLKNWPLALPLLQRFLS